jgi:hypothetical protein
MITRIYLVGILVLILPAFWCSAVGKRPYYFSVEVKKPVNPLDYYPLDIGTTWIYDQTYKTVTGVPARLITITWESEETVLAHYEYPEGILIVRRIRNRHVVHDYPEDIAQHLLQGFCEGHPIPDEEMAYYFVRGNYLYTATEQDWDREHQTLSQRYRQQIQHDPGTPAFFFPLEEIRVWGDRSREYEDYHQGELWKQGKGPAPNPVMYYWYVEEMTDVCVPLGCLQEVIPLIYRQVSGPERIWFKNGIGIVREQYTHQGTYLETEKVLKQFMRP